MLCKYQSQQDDCQKSYDKLLVRRRILLENSRHFGFSSIKKKLAENLEALDKIEFQVGELEDLIWVEELIFKEGVR